MKYQLAGLAFPTKAAIVAHVQALVRRYAPRGRLSVDDQRFVEALVERHPSAATKIGAGIVAIEVRPGPLYRHAWMLVLLRADGSETDVSYRECLCPSSQAADARKAFRGEVEDQIALCKAMAFLDPAGVSCAISGRRLERPEAADVDHHPMSFRDLVAAFVARETLDLQALETREVTHASGLGTGKLELCDRGLAERWRSYHLTEAGLRVVGRKEHRTATQVNATGRP